MTVGADRPVNSCILESLRATSTCSRYCQSLFQENDRKKVVGTLKILTKGASASDDSRPIFLESFSYCSMQRRIVAPSEPVPERRKTYNPNKNQSYKYLGICSRRYRNMGTDITNSKWLDFFLISKRYVETSPTIRKLHAEERCLFVTCTCYQFCCIYHTNSVQDKQKDSNSHCLIHLKQTSMCV